MGRPRTRPRLFSFSREIELAPYDELVRAPEARARLEQAVDAFVAICDDRTVNAERLAALVAAATSDDPNVRMAGMNRLAVLSHYFDEASGSVREFVDHPDAEVRHLASASLANMPPSLVTELLPRYLDDPEWRVRKTAAQVAATLPLRELIPALRAHAARERDARVRVVLQLALDFQVKNGAGA